VTIQRNSPPRCGPVTPRGKAVVSQNAVTHGLYIDAAARRCSQACPLWASCRVKEETAPCEVELAIYNDARDRLAEDLGLAGEVSVAMVDLVAQKRIRRWRAYVYLSVKGPEAWGSGKNKWLFNELRLLEDGEAKLLKDLEDLSLKRHRGDPIEAIFAEVDRGNGDGN